MIRFEVAFALPSVAGDPVDDLAVAALVRLTRDTDAVAACDHST